MENDSPDKKSRQDVTDKLDDEQLRVAQASQTDGEDTNQVVQEQDPENLDLKPKVVDDMGLVEEADELPDAEEEQSPEEQAQEGSEEAPEPVFEGEDNSLTNQQQRYFETPKEPDTGELSPEERAKRKDEAEDVEERRMAREGDESTSQELKIEDDGHDLPPNISYDGSVAEPNSAPLNVNIDPSDPRDLSFDDVLFVPPEPVIPVPPPLPPTAMQLFREAVNESNELGTDFVIQLGVSQSGNSNAFIQLQDEGGGRSTLDWDAFDPFGNDNSADVDITNGVLTIRGEGCDKTFLDANFLSRLFDIADGAQVILEDLTLTHGKDTHGGAILNAGNLTLIDVCIVANEAEFYGGGIRNDGDASIFGSSFEANFAGSAGGGIATFSANSLDNVINTDFFANSTGGSGGAIYTEGHIQNFAFNDLFGNQALDSGGAIAIATSGMINLILDNNFNFNAALNNDGGAIDNDGHIQDFLINTLSGNIALNGMGGGISNDGTIVDIASSMFMSNFAELGGGAIANFSANTIESIDTTDFLSNTTAGHGGALFNGIDGVIHEITNSNFGEISQLTAFHLGETSGGIPNGLISTSVNIPAGSLVINGIDMEGTYTNPFGQDSLTTYLNSKLQGSGVQAQDLNSSPFTEDIVLVSTDGTPITVETNGQSTTPAQLNLSNFDIGGGVSLSDTAESVPYEFAKGNEAEGSGGAIYNEGLLGELVFDQSGQLTGIEGGIFNSQFAGNLGGDQGGAISSDGLINLVDASQFYANQSINDGGAIYISNPNPVLGIFEGIIDSRFYSNTTVEGSGGALANTATIVNIDGSTFGDRIDNELINLFLGLDPDFVFDLGNQAALGEGGAVYNDGAIINFLDSELRFNSAESGGGLANDDFIQNLTDNLFWVNGATLGGGIYNFGTITNLQSSFTENIAVDSGGGIYNQNIIENLIGVFRENFALSSGGGTYNEGTIVNLDQSVYRDNFALNTGGGLHNDGTLTNLKDTNFFQNLSTSGAGLYNADGSLVQTMFFTNFENNEAVLEGGGLYNGGLIESYQNGFFSENTARDGAGIFNEDTILNAALLTMDNNDASMAGGGIFNDVNALFNSIINSSITNNSSTFGGGIYNLGSFGSSEVGDNPEIINGFNEVMLSQYGLVPYMTESGFLNVFISSNTADVGGGIFNGISGYIQEIEGSTLDDNSATAGGGGAVYNQGDIFAIFQTVFDQNSASGGEFDQNDGFQQPDDSFGGAIYNARTGDIAILSETHFDSNTAELDGGAIYNLGHLFAISQSLFTENQAAFEQYDSTGRGGHAIANASSGGETGATNGIDYIINSTFAENGNASSATLNLGVYDPLVFLPSSLLINGEDIFPFMGLTLDLNGNAQPVSEIVFLSALNRLGESLDNDGMGFTVSQPGGLGTEIILTSTTQDPIRIESITAAGLGLYELNTDPNGQPPLNDFETGDLVINGVSIEYNNQFPDLTDPNHVVDVLNDQLPSNLRAAIIPHELQTNSAVDYIYIHAIDNTPTTITIQTNLDVGDGIDGNGVLPQEDPTFSEFESNELKTFEALFDNQLGSPATDTYGGAILNTTTFENFALIAQEIARIGEITFSTFYNNVAEGGGDAIYNVDFNTTPTPFDAIIASINNSVFAQHLPLTQQSIEGDLSQIIQLYNSYESNHGIGGSLTNNPDRPDYDIVSGNIDEIRSSVISLWPNFLSVLADFGGQTDTFLPQSEFPTFFEVFIEELNLSGSMQVNSGPLIDLANPLVSAFFTTLTTDVNGNLTTIFSDIDQRGETRPYDIGDVINSSSFSDRTITLENYNPGATGTLAEGDFVLNGINIVGEGLTDVQSLADLINENADLDNVTASVSGNNLILTPDDDTLVALTTEGRSNLTIDDPQAPSFDNFNPNRLTSFVLEGFDLGNGTLDAGDLLLIFATVSSGVTTVEIEGQVTSLSGLANLIESSADGSIPPVQVSVIDNETLKISIEVEDGELSLVTAKLEDSTNDGPTFSNFPMNDLDTDEFFETSPISGNNSQTLVAVNIDSNWDRGAVEVQPGELVTPIIFDLDNDGVELISAQDSKITLADSEGNVSKMGWVSGDDAILVYDHNQDGLVTSLNEIALTKWSDSAKTDLEALREVFDSNKDGVFDNMDETFGHFGVWQDINENGSVDENEYQSLVDSGIQSIELDAVESVEWEDGNVSFAEGDFILEDGSEGVFGDIGLGLEAMLESEAMAVLASEEGPTFMDGEMVVQEDMVVPQTDPSATFTIDTGQASNELVI